MVSVSFVSVEKYELQMRKKVRNFFHPFFCPKSAVRKNFDVIFQQKCSLRNACILYETMDPVSGLDFEK